MGNCTKKTQNTNESEIILSIFGLDDAGKTTTTKVLAGEKDHKDVEPTLGYQFTEFKYNSQKIKLIDLAGGSGARGLWKHYFAESYGFIFVIDSSNRKRLDESKNEFIQFIQNDKVADKPILILANKQDKSTAVDESELLQIFNLEELVNTYRTPCRVETVSVISLEGKKIDKSLKAGFDWLMKFINTEFDSLKTRIDRDVQEQKRREAKEKKEKSDRVRMKREQEGRYKNDDDDSMEYTQIKRDPFRPIGEKLKDDKFKSNGDSNRLSSYDKPDHRSASPRGRLSPINEEKNKYNMNSSRSKFGKNKLAPIDDSSDGDLRNVKNNKTTSSSWAITSSSS